MRAANTTDGGAGVKTVIAHDVFTVAGLLTPAECRALIDRGEALGFVPAPVRAAGGPTRRADIRDNDRAAFADPALAAWLWDRCREHVPADFRGGVAVGLDPDFRVYRYDPGQRFNRHKDGVATRGESERTRLTGLVYLNDDFIGGETAFYAADLIDGARPEVAAVTPQTGSALFFRHDWWHEGRAVTAGRKYVLRTDVFFQFAPE